jgi:ubiquinone/menaquinone biosynthesis C-methylase UbiE
VIVLKAFMKEDRKFNPKSIDKLNDPARFQRENPDLIWSELKLEDPKTLVDIGAGTGFFAVPFARKMTSGVVYACDILDEMLSWLKEHIPGDVKERIIPVKMTETAVPLQDGMADLVYMINLHHELEDSAAILKESGRLLKAGGMLMIVDWKEEETPAGPPLEIRVARGQIIADMENAGFVGIDNHPVLPYHNFLTGRKQSGIQ